MPGKGLMALLGSPKKKKEPEEGLLLLPGEEDGEEGLEMDEEGDDEELKLSLVDLKSALDSGDEDAMVSAFRSCVELVK